MNLLVQTDNDTFEIYKKEVVYFLLKDNSFYEIGTYYTFREYMISYYTIHIYDNIQINGKRIHNKEQLLNYI